jgi:hypothetical protein
MSMTTLPIRRLFPFVANSTLRRAVRERLVSLSVTHVHGPKYVRLDQNQAAVTCVVRNGAFYIEAFIRHYKRMGFKHIFFLDNGSSDETLSLIRQHDNVSICTSTLPVDANQRIFKKHLAAKSVIGGWCLDADIDELFEYPSSDVLKLSDFLDYLNNNRYTAVITQLLDMFSDQPLGRLARNHEQDLQRNYRYFDISAITKTKYAGSDVATKHGGGNQLADNDSSLYWGGIRKTLYGNDCLLTKHSLFYTGAKLDLFPHVHFVNNARLADVSCAMLHYKLTANALDIAQQNSERFTANARSYYAFIDLLETSPNLQIRQESAQKLDSVNDLVSLGFLTISRHYERYLNMFQRKISHEATASEALLRAL